MVGRSIKRLFSVPLTLSLLVLATAACVGYGNVGTVTSTIDQGNASSVTASFAIGDGQIDINGGADALMQASFTTNDKRTPKVAYNVNERTGSLIVTQSSKTTGFNIGPITNHWSVDLNDDVPLDLSITSKSAESKLDLDTLTMKSIQLSSDGGETTISLSGAQNQLNKVSVRSASGDIHLKLDGDYRAPATIHIDSSSGNVTTDLSGKWSGDVTGTFKTDSGSIVLIVPKNIGVRINASTDSGYVDASGFTSRGQDVYVNDKASVSNAPMQLDIQSSNGNITIRTAS